MSPLFDLEPCTPEAPPEPEGPRSIAMPFFAGPYPGDRGGFMASTEQRMTVLGRLFSSHDRSLDDVPEVHRARGPLSGWCWLVLVVNGITPEVIGDGQPYSLVHYGVDLGFTETEVRSWIVWLA